MRVFLVRVKQRLGFKLRVVTEDTGRPRSERDGATGSMETGESEPLFLSWREGVVLVRSNMFEGRRQKGM